MQLHVRHLRDVQRAQLCRRKPQLDYGVPPRLHALRYRVHVDELHVLPRELDVDAVPHAVADSNTLSHANGEHDDDGLFDANAKHIPRPYPDGDADPNANTFAEFDEFGVAHALALAVGLPGQLVISYSVKLAHNLADRLEHADPDRDAKRVDDWLGVAGGNANAVCLPWLISEWLELCDHNTEFFWLPSAVARRHRKRVAGRAFGDFFPGCDEHPYAFADCVRGLFALADAKCLNGGLSLGCDEMYWCFNYSCACLHLQSSSPGSPPSFSNSKTSSVTPTQTASPGSSASPSTTASATASISVTPRLPPPTTCVDSIRVRWL